MRFFLHLGANDQPIRGASLRGAWAEVGVDLDVDASSCDLLAMRFESEAAAYQSAVRRLNELVPTWFTVARRRQQTGRDAAARRGPREDRRQWLRPRRRGPARG